MDPFPFANCFCKNMVMEAQKCLKVLKELRGNLKQLLPLSEYDKVFKLIEEINHNRQRYNKKLIRENFEEVMYSSGTYRDRLNSKINYQNKLDGTNLELLPISLPSKPPTSPLPLTCHICKNSFVPLHHHYYSLCPPCASFNYAQRLVTADLSSKTSIVTGGRIKIGFEIAKKLLRCGSRVIITTRFPEDALRRYQIEEDYSTWAKNLVIVYLDLINFQQVLKFVEWVKSEVTQLEILILNAAQTVSREPIFYEAVKQDYNRSDHIIKFERRESLYDPRALTLNSLTRGEDQLAQILPGPTSGHRSMTPFEVPFELDEDHQLKEYRDRNTWSERLDDFSMKDFLSILIINLFSPACLVRLLTPLFKREVDGKEHSFVILVSAVEGMFKINTKGTCHPHTNAAKAGLNMLTRTSGWDYKSRFNILMNSVDTGFITVETKNEGGFVPPLDNIDGMARVLHPVFEAVNNNRLFYRKMMKNFKCVDF